MLYMFLTRSGNILVIRVAAKRVRVWPYIFQVNSTCFKAIETGIFVTFMCRIKPANQPLTQGGRRD